MDLTSALIATGILLGVAVVFLVLWDALLSPLVMFALKAAFFAALGVAVFLFAALVL